MKDDSRKSKVLHALSTITAIIAGLAIISGVVMIVVGIVHMHFGALIGVCVLVGGFVVAVISFVLDELMYYYLQ